MWDQTLIFDEITLYGPPEHIAQNPPQVVIEVFDKDMIVSSWTIVMFTNFYTYFWDLTSGNDSILTCGIDEMVYV